MNKFIKLLLTIILSFYLQHLNLSYLWAGESLNSDVNVGDPDQGVYPFKPGDGLAINTFPDTSSFLNNIFPIDDMGFAEFPIVGKVRVSAMSVKELETYLKDTFKGWLRNPNIYIKPVIRISLVGGFRRPGMYYIDQNSSLWEAVRLAGGHILEDGIYDMKWERNGEEQKSNLTQYYEAGISLKRMGFRSGDQLSTKPPDSETAWDTINNFMPFITLATTITLAYMTYQQSVLQIQYRR